MSMLIVEKSNAQFCAVIGDRLTSHAHSHP